MVWWIPVNNAITVLGPASIQLSAEEIARFLSVVMVSQIPTKIAITVRPTDPTPPAPRHVEPTVVMVSSKEVNIAMTDLSIPIFPMQHVVPIVSQLDVVMVL